VVHLGRLNTCLLDEGVEACEALIDGGLFERTVEDIDHLVLTGHDTFLRSGAAVFGSVAPGLVRAGEAI
jgi:hypothetical protein